MISTVSESLYRRLRGSSHTNPSWGIDDLPNTERNNSTRAWSDRKLQAGTDPSTTRTLVRWPQMTVFHLLPDTIPLPNHTFSDSLPCASPTLQSRASARRSDLSRGRSTQTAPDRHCGGVLESWSREAVHLWLLQVTQNLRSSSAQTTENPKKHTKMVHDFYNKVSVEPTLNVGISHYQ